MDISAVYTVAINTMAPRSSMTANATIRIFNPSGTRFPSSASTPSANAMSVAIGIPKPAWDIEPAFSE